MEEINALFGNLTIKPMETKTATMPSIVWSFQGGLGQYKSYEPLGQYRSYEPLMKKREARLFKKKPTVLEFRQKRFELLKKNREIKRYANFQYLHNHYKETACTKQYYFCPQCRIQILKSSKTRHEKSKRHLNIINLYKCCCGTIVKKTSKCAHEKSQKHNNWLYTQF